MSVYFAIGAVLFVWRALVVWASFERRLRFERMIHRHGLAQVLFYTAIMFALWPIGLFVWAHGKVERPLS